MKEQLLKDVLKGYTKHTSYTFNSANPALADYTKAAFGTGVLGTGSAQLFYTNGGLFTDCELEAPVINAMIQPQNSLANMIPVFMDNREIYKYAFVTDIDEGETTLPSEPCDFGPAPGDVSNCTMSLGIGRYSSSTKTIELEDVFMKAHRGIHEDLYLLGKVRGVSAIPTVEQMADRDFVQRAAVRRQMMLSGRKLQRSLLRAFWQGDIADAAQNTVGGGRVSIQGLNFFINNDYGSGSKDGIAGTLCDNLNSSVSDWASTAIDGTHPVTGSNIYDTLRIVEQTIYNRGVGLGLAPLQYVLVMRPELFYALTNVFPCQQLTGSCNNTLSMQASDGIVTVLQETIASRMALNLNGRIVSVIVDDTIPLTKTTVATGVQYVSDIYLVTTTVMGGEPVINWRMADFRMAGPILGAAIPGYGTNVLLSGWTDGGRFDSRVVLGGNGRCLRIDLLTRPMLEFRAPMLSARITNISSTFSNDVSSFDSGTLTI